MLPGEDLSFIVTGETLPVLHDATVAEAGLAQGSGGVFGQRLGECQEHRFLAFVAGTRLAGKGATAESGPFLDLRRVAGAVAQGQKSAVEGVAIEVQQPGLLGQGAGLDQATGALLALIELELGFRLSKAGFLLFMSTQALAESAGDDVFSSG
jgi:hypothetical protein